MIYAVIDLGFHRWQCIGYEKWESRPSRIYNIGMDKKGVWCSCPATLDCKHIAMMRDRKRKPGLWFDAEDMKWKKIDLV